MTTHPRSAHFASSPRRLIAALAALVAVWGGLGIHLGPHGHSDELLPATDTIAACASHLRALHVEAQRTLHLRECPACLLSHSNVGAVRPLSPALAATAPQDLPAPAPLVVSLLALPAPSSRGPPALSI